MLVLHISDAKFNKSIQKQAQLLQSHVAQIGTSMYSAIQYVLAFELRWPGITEIMSQRAQMRTLKIPCFKHIAASILYP